MKKRCIFFKAIFSLLIFALTPAFSQEALPTEEEAAMEEVLEEGEPTDLAEQASTNLDGEEPETLDGQEVEDAVESVVDEYLSFVDSSKKIRLLETKDDIFSANHGEGGKRALVSFFDGKFQRRFYDENLRLSKVEYWKMAASSAESKMEREVTYNLPEKDGAVYSIFERNFLEKTQTRTFYYSDGKIKSQRKNFFKAAEKKEEPDVLDSFEIFTCTYDEAGRLIQERRRKYALVNKLMRLVNEKTNVDRYVNGKRLLSSFYENSVLRVRTVFPPESPDDYIRTTYFDGGFMVREFYKDGVKVATNFGGAD